MRTYLVLVISAAVLCFVYGLPHPQSGGKGIGQGETSGGFGFAGFGNAAGGGVGAVRGAHGNGANCHRGGGGGGGPPPPPSATTTTTTTAASE